MAAILGTTNADLIYDFNRNAGHVVTPAIPWNMAGADILGDIDDDAWEEHDYDEG
jgi:hypothetical protein